MANPQKENGYVPIAVEIFDHLCSTRIAGEVRQIVDVVLRKTYGFQKKDDFISNSQFCEYTGMKKGNVTRSLLIAIDHKIIIRNSDNSLSFNKDYEQWKPFKKVIKSDNTTVIKSDNKVIKSDNTVVIKSETKVIKSDNDLLSKVSPTIDNKDIITKEIRKPVIKSDNSKKTQIPEWIDKETWDAFVEMRRAIHHPITEHGKRLIIKDLENFKQLGDDANELLNKAIKGSWRGIFSDKVKHNGHTPEQKQLKKFTTLADIEANQEIKS